MNAEMVFIWDVTPFCKAGAQFKGDMLDKFLRSKASYENRARNLTFKAAEGKMLPVGEVKHEYILYANEGSEQLRTSPMRAELVIPNVRSISHESCGSFQKLLSFTFIGVPVMLRSQVQAGSSLLYVVKGRNTEKGTPLVPSFDQQMAIYALMESNKDISQSLPVVMKSCRLLTGKLERNRRPDMEAFFKEPMIAADIAYIADILGADIEKNRNASSGAAISPYLTCHGQFVGLNAHVKLNVMRPLDNLRLKLKDFGNNCLTINRMAY